MKLKYVIYEKNEIQFPVIFSPIEDHSDIAEKIDLKLVSAGTVEFKDNKVRCSGDSFTLKLKSRFVEDEKIIRQHSKIW
jgi:hypothetical protein